jgi:hypothetical protein
MKQPVHPLLTVEPVDVIVESLEPLDDGKTLLVLLYNPAASPAAVSLTGRDGGRVPVTLCDPSGKASGAPLDEITLAPYSSRYVRTGEMSK